MTIVRSNKLIRKKAEEMLAINIITIKKKASVHICVYIILHSTQKNFRNMENFSEHVLINFNKDDEGKHYSHSN